MSKLGLYYYDYVKNYRFYLNNDTFLYFRKNKVAYANVNAFNDDYLLWRPVLV